MARTDTFTRWSVVASGEGGGRIATEFFNRSENPGIDDRILVMNTNRADLRNTINRMQDRSTDDIDTLMADYALDFGTQQGAGNFFPGGEQAAQEDFERIVENLGEFDVADAFLYVATLGGGTGNGSIPYVIDQFKSGYPDLDDRDATSDWMDSAIHVAFGVWPHYYENSQRHFNAVCGLSRLLRTQNNNQNADMVLLAANSHIEENGRRGEYDGINQSIIKAIDLMIGAGRETRGVIDVQDYITIPSQFDAYHFTPAVATGLDGSVYELEYMFEQAAENTYVPLDLGTVKAAFAIVRAPQDMIDNGDITEPEVYDAFQDWEQNHDLNLSGQASLIPKSGRGRDVDVLLLLAGFDLNPLLDHSWDEFEQFRSRLSGGADLSERELEQITKNLEEYVDKNAE